MRKMTVGTLTFHRANNYGAVLQSYALQQYLLENNLDCKIINVDLLALRKLNKFVRMLHLIKQKTIFIRDYKEWKKNRTFSIFRENFLKLTNPIIYDEKDLKTISNFFDIIVVGSDQIWNSDITYKSQIFYVDFSDKLKKVAYAASYGRDYLKESEIESAKKYLSKFDAISVREQNAEKELKNIINKKIVTVVDPVFLLTKTEWNKLPLSKRKNDFILVYLMESNRIVRDLINKIKSQTNQKIIIINGGEKKNYKNFGKVENTCGPIEFLSLINEASTIITNSFHGLAFSIIFKKKVICIKHSNRNERLINLLKTIKCDQKQIDSAIKINNYEKYIIDGELEYPKMEKYITESKKFIKDNIINGD